MSTPGRHLTGMATVGLVAAMALLGFLTTDADEISFPSARPVHEGIDCSRCHAVIADLNGTMPARRADSECLTCHRKQASGHASPDLSFTTASRACGTCHFFHRPDSLVVANQEFSFNRKHPAARAVCQSCHAPGASLQRLSPGHRQAALIFHSDQAATGQLSPSEACLLCHSDQSAVVLEGFPSFPRFNAHLAHPVGVEVSPGKELGATRLNSIVDSRLALYNGRVECQSCHVLTAGTRYSLVPLENQNQLCRGCHLID